MTINKIVEFAKTGDKNTTDLDLDRGFPSKLKPARQWWNYLFNLYALKINEIIDGKLGINDDAVSAAKLSTARTITLSGAVSGAGEFDGTGDLSIPTTVDVENTLTSSSVLKPLSANQGKVLNDKMFGVGQSTQNVTASRALGATYTNTTGRPITVSVCVTIQEETTATLTVAGQIVSQFYQAVDGATGFMHATHSWTVQNGETYSAIGGTLVFWKESR